MKKITLKQIVLFTGIVLASQAKLALAASALDVLDPVTTASFSFATGRLSLRLKNAAGATVRIPAAYLTAARYKDTARFIILNLSNGVESTTLVINKTSNKVYLTKDTRLKALDLRRVSETTLEVDGATEPVLRLRAELENGTSQWVGLGAVDNSLNAYKM